MFKSRIFAYIIDMIIVILLLNLILCFFKPTNNYVKLNNELDNLNESYINGKINTTTFINNQADIVHDLDKEKFLSNILEAFILIGYFIILPYLNNGKTLGKQLMKIKIIGEDGNLDYNKLIIRALVIDGLGYLLIMLGSVYILPSMGYFVLITILSIMEIILFISGIVLIIKNGEQGLHDKISKTKVIHE